MARLLSKFSPCLLALATLLCPARANTPFTIVALPDTQNYVNNSSNVPFFDNQTQWIADQIQTAGNPRNIQFVTHLGDVVSNGDSITQLERADGAMDRLDGVVKYSVLPGNHDYADTGNKFTGTNDYLDYFGPQRFAGQSWFGGADPSGNNSYQLFTAGGYDFLHLALEWQPASNIPERPVSPLAWAQSVLDAHPDRPAILSTHEYIDDSPPGRGGAGDALWDNLVRYNDQIFMVLNGHNHGAGGANDGEYHQVSNNDAGRPVFEVLQDYQDYPNGGDGWLRLIEFDVPNNEIKFETYSTEYDQFQTERTTDVGAFASQFEFSVDFADRLDPVFIERPEPPPAPAVPDFVIQNGVSGYSGTSDKEIRSSGGDSSNGQSTEISVDGDDGSPGNQPNQALIQFADIIGTGIEQIPVDAEIEQAILKLQVFNPGSGFNVHDMLIDWDESDTWSSLGSGVQTNDVEASIAPVTSVGANDGGSNVLSGSLELDVTSSIQAYLEGTLDNKGWALIPFVNGTNGIDFFTSEAGIIAQRPSLEVFFADVPGDFNGDDVVDLADYTIWRNSLGESGSDLPADADGNGMINEADYQIWKSNYGLTQIGLQTNANSTGVPEPAAAWLTVFGLTMSIVIRSRRSTGLLASK